MWSKAHVYFSSEDDTEPVFLEGYWGGGGGNRFLEWVGTKFGTESAMSHKMLIFKAGIDLSSRAETVFLKF